MTIGRSVTGRMVSKQSRRTILLNLPIFTSLFLFYYVFLVGALPGISDNLAITQAAFLFTVAITMLLVSHLKYDLGKKHIVIFSLALIVTLLSLLIKASFPYTLLSIILTGVFFGISQLAYYKLFWANTDGTRRSRIAGIIGFISLIIYFPIISIALNALVVYENIALCILLAAGTAIGGVLFREETDKEAIKRKIVYYPEKRTIILYAVPWILFTFLNVTLTKNITVTASVLSSSTMYLLLSASQIVGGIIGALLGGYFADKVGRRLTLIFSVALYGISMAFRGFTDNGPALLSSFIGEGLTWGIFLVLYSFVIWGDLANTKNVTKLYAIGLLSFYVTAGIGSFELTANISVVNSTLISCILIFLAIIPIAMAPELLTTEAQEKIKLTKYMKKAQKIANSEST
jgi:hypothetical protein